MKKKILAVSSGGGHWIQLNRISPAFQGHEIIWCTVEYSMKDKVEGRFFSISDANFSTKIQLFKTFYEAWRIVRKTRPDIVISTGAAPGVFCLFWGKLFRAKVMWIDSIANVEKLSLSGRIAVKFADVVLTQWEKLSDSKKVLYRGTVV